MGAPNTSNVLVGLTGGVRVAPVGTTAPATSIATYAAGWTELGYISEDGITESNSSDATEIKAFQGGVTVRKVISSSETTFAFTIIETNKDVWALYYPGSTFATATGTTTATIKVPAADPRAFAFDVVDGARHYRILVPKGEISERGDLVYKNDEAVGYEFTMTCYPASDGTVMIKLSDDAAVAVP
jgi:hypothetical protein